MWRRTRTARSSCVTAVSRTTSYERPDGHLPLRLSRLASMRHRVEQDVDADRIAFHGKPQEILVAVAFPLETVAEIRIVGDEHHDAAVVVEDGARMRGGAIGPPFRRAAAASEPEDVPPPLPSQKLIDGI